MPRTHAIVIRGYLCVSMGWLLLGIVCGFAVLGIEPAPGETVMPWMLRSSADAIALVASIAVLMVALRRGCGQTGRDSTGLKSSGVAFAVATIVGAIGTAVLLQWINGSPFSERAFAMDVLIRLSVVPTALAPAFFVIWRQRSDEAHAATLKAVVETHERAKRKAHDVLHGEVQSEILAAQMLLSRFRSVGNFVDVDEAHFLLQRTLEESLPKGLSSHKGFSQGVSLSAQLNEVATRLLGPGKVRFDIGTSAQELLDHDVARALWLLVNEALCNAVKHGDPSSVRCAWNCSRSADGATAAWELDVWNLRRSRQGADAAARVSPPLALQAYASLLGAELSVPSTADMWRVTASGVLHLPLGQPQVLCPPPGGLCNVS